MENIVDFIKNSPNSIYGKGVEKEAIKEAEESLNLEFSKEFKKYLRTYGLAALDGIELLGLGGDLRTDVVTVTKEKKAFFENIPEDLYVVECANFDGITIWQSNDGIIYECGFGVELKEIAESLVEYLKSIQA